jgi:hypothetical protein
MTGEPKGLLNLISEPMAGCQQLALRVARTTTRFRNANGFIVGWRRAVPSCPT